MSAPWKGPLRLDHDTGYLPDIVDANDLIVAEAVDVEEGVALVHRANAYDVLVEALERIEKHPATDYGYHGPAQSDGDRQYQIGVTDGHRLAAQIARAALASTREEG